MHPSFPQTGFLHTSMIEKCPGNRYFFRFRSLRIEGDFQNCGENRLNLKFGNKNEK